MQTNLSQNLRTELPKSPTVPVSLHRFAFWPVHFNQPFQHAYQSSLPDLRDLDQRVRESGEW